MIERFGPYLELATIAETLGDAGAHRLRLRSAHPRSGGLVPPGLARRDGAARAIRWWRALTERGRDFTAGAAARAARRCIGGAGRRRWCRATGARRARPVRAVGDAVRSPDHSAAARFQVRARSGAGDAAAAAPGLRRAARSAPRWHVEEAMRVLHARLRRAPGGLLAGGRRDQRARRSSCWHRRRLSLGGEQRRGAARQPRAQRSRRRPPTRWPTTGLTASPAPGSSCFFRDDALSDLIGFTYATWHGDDAAHNLVNELAQLAQRYDGSANHAVLIALDGENAWEHYPFNGYYFLQGAVRAARRASAARAHDAVGVSRARHRSRRRCRRCMAGSWVHGTLATWMGDAAKNRAWDLLCDAKQAFDRVDARSMTDAGAARAGRPAAGAVRELRLVLVVRRLQPGRCGQPVRPAVSPAAGHALPAA